MWSPATLTKINAKKKPSMEELAAPLMEKILSENGLQITLKILIDALDKMIKTRGKDHLNLMIVEGLRGLYKGYMRRHEPNEDDIPWSE